MWECRCVDCVLSSVFGLRADFDADTSDIFPQGVLATVALIGSVAGVGGRETCAVCAVNFLCAVALPGPSGLGCAPPLPQQKS